METHKDLRIWQHSIDFVLMLYKVTETFPATESFGLVSQMRRAAVSIPSNIAEGYARGNEREILHFLHISSGSISELDTQLMLSNKLCYINNEQYALLSDDLTYIWKQMNALISSIKRKLDDKTSQHPHSQLLNN